MNEKIMQLHNEGKSYKEIKKLLGCSLGTISYYCGKGQKEKTANRNRFNQKTLLNILKRKKDNFACTGERRRSGRKRVSSSFSSMDFFKKLTDLPVCYLTGRAIDLTLPKTFQCDHIIPVSKGGSNDIDNLGLTCKEANIAKGTMLIEEFLMLCREVLEHHGYNVIKKDS